jgi:transforming growth factor-beta-induced protein
MDVFLVSQTSAVFAPTNDAFDKLPPGALDYLLANPAELTKVLQYHVIAAEVFSRDISQGQTAETLLTGESLTFHFSLFFSWTHWFQWLLFVNYDTQVIFADIDASNGVVHVIDQVLIPPSVKIPLDIVDTALDAAPEFSLLVAALQSAELVDALRATGPFTVFAPTNEAFNNLPAEILAFLLTDLGRDALTEILLYHVAAGEVRAADILDGSVTSVTTLSNEELTFAVGSSSTVEINGGAATVVVADVDATNGIIHVIDAVLLPPGILEDLPKNIVATAVSVEGEFNTLVAAITAAGLAATLSTGGPFTVFAPTDAAFASLPDGEVERLLEDPTGELADILKYHVVSGLVTAEAAKALAGHPVDTLNGKSIEISLDGDDLLINDSTVISPDIVALNGIIHVIDQVLLPPEGDDEDDPIYCWFYYCWY